MTSTADVASTTAPATGARQPRALLWLLLAIVGVLAVGLINIRGGPGLEPTDAWVAQTAREMCETPDWRGWVVPHFSGEVRMQKSPGPYWLVAAISKLRGGEVDIVSIRLPNILAVVLLVVTTFWLTSEIAGRRAAAFAAMCTASTGIVLAWTSRGASDFGLAALMALSLTSLWVATERRERGASQTALWLLGYFAAGLAMLYKMPMPLVCVGLPVFVYLTVRLRWRVLLDWRHLVGLALFALPWLPWAILVTQLEPHALYKWKVEYLDRMTGELPNYDEQKRWTTYLYYFGLALGFCLPYSASLPIAVLRPFRREENVDRRGIWFVQIWFWSLMAFFTLSGGKENRYFLPMLPPLMVLLGGELSAFFHPQRRVIAAIDRIVPWLLGVLIPAGFVAVGVVLRKQWYPTVADMVAWGEVQTALLVMGAILTLTAVMTALLLQWRREHGAFLTLALGMWAVWAWTAGALLPLIASDQPLREFSGQLRDRLGDEQRTALRQVAVQDPRVIWYSDVRFPRAIDQLRLLEMQGGKRSRETETRLIGEEIVRRLEARQLALFLATSVDYVTFELLAPMELARLGREMPARYVWLYSRLGRFDQRFVVFGNQPPPWMPPTIELPDKLSRRLETARADAAAELAAHRADSTPTSEPASRAAP